MKLTDENKIEMYRLKKEGYSNKELSKKFKTLNKNNLIFCPTFWVQYQLIMSKDASYIYK